MSNPFRPYACLVCTYEMCSLFLILVFMHCIVAYHLAMLDDERMDVTSVSSQKTECSWTGPKDGRTNRSIDIFIGMLAEQVPSNKTVSLNSGKPWCITPIFSSTYYYIGVH